MNFQFAKFQDSAATVAGRVGITATDLAGQEARAAVEWQTLSDIDCALA
jgi:hypothetical protein